MKMKFFSDIQESAIEARIGNTLVSAGAGSGKTAVLTERIYRIAKDDKTLDHFLVLTFTNLAAGEMKDRVRKKLLDDESIAYLASEVDDAHIETFDSFSLFLAKKYFYKIGISSDINILDNSIQTIQRRKILDEIFISLYDKKDQDFERLILEYCVKDEKALKNFILKLLDKADKKANNIEFLKSFKAKIENDDLVNFYKNSYIKELKDRLVYIYNMAEHLEEEKDSEQIQAFVSNLLSIDDYDTFRVAASQKFPTKPVHKKEEEKFDDGDFRASIADIYNKKIKFAKDHDYGDSITIKEEFDYIKPFINKIVDIAIEVEERLNDFKNSLNAFSFGDISRFVLSLLEDESIREEISKTFEYIMIDEYQDTNDIQETVINKISRNNVYMVGDVKQSIYRFRGADCHIFQEKYESYSKGIGGTKIDLNTSYRSRKEVVDFINDIFSSLMNKNINAIDYEDGHHFEFGNKKAYEEIVSPSDYKPELYINEYATGDDVVSLEAEIIAKDMLHKIYHGYQIFDPEDKCLRKCDYKDFAIIIDRGTDFEKYAEVLAKHNIPIKIQNKSQLLTSDVSYVTRSLVRLFYYALKGEYGSEYKHAFFSIARSFLYSYSDDILYQINKNNTYLNEEFAQKIELIKEGLRFASIKEVLTKLYDAFNVYESISRIGDYYENVHKIEHFLTIADSLDVLGYTIEDFVTYFNDLDNIEVDIDHVSNDVRDNSVTIINIHKSKGLEYKIIYFPGLYKAFNRMDNNESFMLSSTYGFSLPVQGKDKTLLRHLIQNEENTEDFEEKLRLLYVALTRAREKIILISSLKKLERKAKYPKDAKSMGEILNICGDKLDKYIANYSFDYEQKDDDEAEINVGKIILKTKIIPYKVIVKDRASKTANNDVDESILTLGTELHMYLEKLDFEHEQSFPNISRRMKKCIDNVKHSVLFKGVKNHQIRHEYRFYDEENSVEGYIDALLIKDDEVDIIDFKYSHIDDEAYDKQLRTYKKYIAKVTTLPIKMYLLSASTGEIREVKDE